jgi:hypothetical protein
MSIQEQSCRLQFSPYKKISEVPLHRVQQELITVFKTHGVPDWIKVDNGRPLGDPQLEIIPPLALWLICLGIKVIWNRPAVPQDNTKVERAQGVMGGWTEYDKCEDTTELQVRLWKEADFYNYSFPIKRKGGKRRIESFPTLAHTGKDWNPADFKLYRGLIFLAKGYWERKVNTVGQCSLYGQRFGIGMAYKNQKVSIKLNPQKNVWNISDDKGNFIKEVPTPFSDKSVWDLNFS